MSPWDDAFIIKFEEIGMKKGVNICKPIAASH